MSPVYKIHFTGEMWSRSPGYALKVQPLRNCPVGNFREEPVRARDRGQF